MCIYCIFLSDFVCLFTIIPVLQLNTLIVITITINTAITTPATPTALLLL